MFLCWGDSVEVWLKLRQLQLEALSLRGGRARPKDEKNRTLRGLTV